MNASRNSRQPRQGRQKIAEALYAGIEEYVDSLSGVKVARSEDSPSLPAR